MLSVVVCPINSGGFVCGLMAQARSVTPVIGHALRSTGRCGLESLRDAPPGRLYDFMADANPG